MTLGLGLLWLFMLIGMKWASTKKKYLKWMRPAGPLLACFLGIIIFAANPQIATKYKISLVGKLPQGLPPTSYHLIGFDSLTRFVPAAIAISLISFLELIAIGKAIALKVGYDLPANHELGALGVANLVSSFFSCIPASGSVSRSAVNYATGAQTQFAGFISAVVMMCALLFLTPVFVYLPKFVLSSIIIHAVSSLVAWQESLELWHINKVDWALQLFTFLAVLFLGVEIGIAAAAAASVLVLIVEAARPQVSLLWRLAGTEIYRSVQQRESAGVFVKNVLILRIGAPRARAPQLRRRATPTPSSPRILSLARAGGNLYFANTDYVQATIRAHLHEYSKRNPVKYIVIEMTAVGSMDTAGVQSFKDLISELRRSNITLAFSTVNPRVADVMRASKLIDDIGQQWIHLRVHDAVKYCLGHELTELKNPSALLLSVPLLSD